MENLIRNKTNNTLNAIELPFEHAQHAHCETGVTVNLLKNMGVEISEPLAFGLGSGLYFVHFPFIKVTGKPAVGYRQWFVSIFRNLKIILFFMQYQGVLTKMATEFSHPIQYYLIHSNKSKME